MLVISKNEFFQNFYVHLAGINNLNTFPLTQRLVESVNLALAEKSEIRLSGYLRSAAPEPPNRIPLVEIINNVLYPSLDFIISSALTVITKPKTNATYIWNVEPNLILELAQVLSRNSKLRKLLLQIISENEQEYECFLSREINGKKNKDLENFKRSPLSVKKVKELNSLKKEMSHLSNDLKDFINRIRVDVGFDGNLALVPIFIKKKYSGIELAKISSVMAAYAEIVTPIPIISSEISQELLDVIYAFGVLAAIFAIFSGKTEEKIIHCRVCYRHASSSGLCKRHKLVKGTNNQVAYNRAAKLLLRYVNRLEQLKSNLPELTYGIQSGAIFDEPKRNDDPIGDRGKNFLRIFLLINEYVGDHLYKEFNNLLHIFHYRISNTNVRYQPTAKDFWEEWYRTVIDDNIGAGLLRTRFNPEEIAMDILRFRAWFEVGGNDIQFRPGRKIRINRNEVFSLRASGKSLREIAKLVNCSPESVRQIIKVP